MKDIDYTQSLSEADAAWLRSVGLGSRVDDNERNFGKVEFTSNDSGQELDDDYDGWKVPELKEEADDRKPPVAYASNAKKDELIEALRAWDREHPDAD